MKNNNEITTIYLVRHCQALGNENGTVQGITDNPITQKGAFQLECLANEMASYKIDKIYSSGLKRAIDTAQCIAEKINEKVIIDNSITEINFGLMENKLWSDIPKLFPKEYNDWVYKMYEMEPPQGEKMLDVYKRMQNAILKIVQENRGKTIVISSHGCAIRNYLCFAMFGTIEKIYDVPWQENTAISKIEFDDLTPKVVYAGRCTHLSDDQKTIFNQNWQKKQKM